MEAQRYPQDFDGILAGAPVNQYQAINAAQAWMLQRLFRDKFENNLAFDTDGDGVPDSLTKLNLLSHAVLAKCDAVDGIRDGVIDDPLACRFTPEADLAALMCSGDINADGCFTLGQIQTIKDIYGDGRDSKGALVFKGQALGSEPGWATELVPHKGNRLRPNRMSTAGDHMNLLFYEVDPGVPPADLTNTAYVPNTRVRPPEFAWWTFDIDDFTAGKADVMRAITDSTDPDLTRFLKHRGGKLLLYHGWADATGHPEPTVDYYRAVVDTTFNGDIAAARQSVRLFIALGMGHCGGGPGPDTWDRPASCRLGRARPCPRLHRGEPVDEWRKERRAKDLRRASARGLRRASRRRERSGELGRGPLHVSMTGGRPNRQVASGVTASTGASSARVIAAGSRAGLVRS